MFVEIADGEFIAVDTIASIRRYTDLKETGKRVIFKDLDTNVESIHPETVPILHWLIKTKRGESFQVSSTKGPYYMNVVNMLNVSIALMLNTSIQVVKADDAE